ncbi:unnamed protein product [Nippostrongylus brasiliensis]|uniref:Protein kinase domain-containing protein n=1 Tax=Nippostrongylus brasiliensis TaxID=27835 RepID=A0A0N4YF76_NIPBR|nr:unnamed protein product [Nippostrongylus brasiliensis]
MPKTEYRTTDQEVNFTDADRACPKDLHSAREKPSKDIKALQEVGFVHRSVNPSTFAIGRVIKGDPSDLRNVGFVHRSVNPSTFAIGRVIKGDPSDLRNIYILDFGFAHQYAPRNAYLNRELSRMDDLEMWLYVIVELVKGAVPWVHQRNPKDIFDYQKAVRTGLGLREFLGGEEIS